MLCIGCQEIIGCIKMIPSAVQICRYHRLISRSGQIIYKEIPSVIHTVIFKGCRTFYRSIPVRSDRSLYPCPLIVGISVASDKPPFFFVCIFHNNFFTGSLTLCYMICSAAVLKNIGINTSSLSAVQHYAAEFPCILGKVCRCAPHNI